LLSVTFFVTVGYVVASLVGGEPKGSDEDSGASAIDIAIVLLLAVLVVYVFLNRKKAEPPKWMGKLQSATPKFALTLGLLLMGVFPTDIITSTTVGGYLARQDDPWWYCLPFLVGAMLFLALPALLVLVLGQRGQVFLPKARDWMNTNSWIVNEIVIVFFLVVSINSLVD
jgi:Sap, sulfolipid-1-addressing protein